MIKILIIFPNFNMGGAQKSLISLLKNLDNKKYDITLMIITRGGELESSIPSGIKIINGYDYYKLLENINSKKTRNEVFVFLKNLQLGRALFKLKQGIIFKTRKKAHPEENLWRLVKNKVPVISDPYDICLAYMQGTASFLAIDKVLNAKKKILMFNTDFVDAGYSKKYCRKYFEKADFVVAVSESGRETLISEFPDLSDKIKFIMNVYDIEEIRKSANEQLISIDKFEGIIITSCGRIEIPAKGYDLSLNAAKILRDKGYRFKWYFIGDGASMEQVKQYIYDNNLSDYIVLTGSVLNPYPYIGKCDIFVHASRFEGYGRVVMEAMILGKPIICTCFSSAKKIIKNGINGLIVEMIPEKIAASIEMLINDPQLRIKLSDSHNIDSNSGVENYKKMFDECLK